MTMLGSGIFLACMGIPVAAVAGWVSNRRRLRLQWRDELMDLQTRVYPACTVTEMHAVRKVRSVHQPSPASTEYNSEMSPYSSSAEFVAPNDNIGLHVVPLLTEAESGALLREVKSWTDRFGQPMDERMVTHFETQIKSCMEQEESYLQTIEYPAVKEAVKRIVAELNRVSSMFRQTMLISDHPVGCQLMKAPWGCGDGIRYEKMPASLRYLSDRVEERLQNTGRLRHVYVEYSPCGLLHHEPSCPPGFDGHDYVVIPLRQSQDSTVVTMSPNLRSRQAYSIESMTNSFTSRDIDVAVTPGSMLRVYGPARYLWSWSVRPVSWFGHCTNPVSNHAMSLVESKAPKINWVDVWSQIRNWLRISQSGSKNLTPSTATRSNLSSGDAAVIVLHYEGPRSQGKQRSRMLHPESLLFGFPPKVENFEIWEEHLPSEKDVMDGWLVMWIIQNYREMLGM